jgi:hypothetical protein
MRGDATTSRRDETMRGQRSDRMMRGQVRRHDEKASDGGGGGGGGPATAAALGVAAVDNDWQ